MRIGTYNIFGLRTYPEPDGGAADVADDGRVERFATVFTELGCDLLAVQEGHPSLALMQSIGKGLGDVTMAVFASPVNWPGYLFSRYPILESRTWSHFRPGASAGPLSRCAGAALVDVGESEPWAIVVLHLYPGREETDRRCEEAWILSRRITELQALTSRIVVMGDFNSSADELIHTQLMGRGFVNAMEMAGDGLEPTAKSAGPGHRPIDHIYVSDALAPRLQTARIVREAGFHDPATDPCPGALHSDHLPVLAAISDLRERVRM